MARRLDNRAAAGLRQYGRRSFSSLSVRNYRLYFIGQGISLSGTWVQQVAQTWLILQLTHSGTMLGVVAAAQFLPLLLFGPYGGLIADRFNKRRLLYMTQTAAMVLAFIVAILVASHTVKVWMVLLLATSLGFVTMVDSPTRQTFIIEMVGKDRLTNAISLNSIEVNLARIVGPIIAAALIVKVGLAWCFLINAASYLAVLLCLKIMNGAELRSQAPVSQKAGQLKEGLVYIWRTPVLRNVLLMMALVGALTYEFQVVLPLFATITFHGNAGTFALMMTAMGIGSFVGGLVTASRGNPSPRRLLTATIALGLSTLAVAAAPDLRIALALLFFVGFCSIGFTALTNTTLQLNSSPSMRGRVMSLWVMAFLGSTPVGGPIIGWISEHSSPRLGLVTGGSAAVIAGTFGIMALLSYRRNQASSS